jgi:flagellar motor switch protein FliN/FliY
MSPQTAPISAAGRQPVEEWVSRLGDLLRNLTGAEIDILGAGSAPEPPPSGFIWWRSSAGLTPVTIWIGAASADVTALANRIVVPASTIAEPVDPKSILQDLLDRSWTWNGEIVDRGPAKTVLDAYDVRFGGGESVRLFVALVERTFDPVANLDVLMDVELPVTLRFGATEMLLRDLASLKAGSVIEFDRALNDPVELMVNGRVIARGEAVIVQDSYGFRISEIASPRERLSTSALVAAPAAGAEALRGDF